MYEIGSLIYEVAWLICEAVSLIRKPAWPKKLKKHFDGGAVESKQVNKDYKDS